PRPNMPFTLADESAFVIYDQDAYLDSKESPESLIQAGIFTGPYQVDGVTNQKLTMSANSHYWGGLPPLETVDIKFIEDDDARILAVQNGEADLALYPPTKSKANIKSRSDSFWAEGQPSGSTFQFYMNQR